MKSFWPSRIALMCFRFGFKMPEQNGAEWWWSRKENQLMVKRAKVRLTSIHIIHIVLNIWTSHHPRHWNEMRIVQPIVVEYYRARLPLIFVHIRIDNSYLNLSKYERSTKTAKNIINYGASRVKNEAQISSTPSPSLRKWNKIYAYEGNPFAKYKIFHNLNFFLFLIKFTKVKERMHWEKKLICS